MQIKPEHIEKLEVSHSQILQAIVDSLKIPLNKVKATVGLLQEGSTVPFISRYRKEAIGFLDEVAVRDISNKLDFFNGLEKRRVDIIKSIFEKKELTPELLNNLQKCKTKADLELIYAPYKTAKKTRGKIAKERGLLPLSRTIKTEDQGVVFKEARLFIDEELGVKTQADALQGAKDIIAEELSLQIDLRKTLKTKLDRSARLQIKGKKDAETSVYKMYYDYDMALSNLKPHRVLAINRGEKEGELKAKISYDEDMLFEIIKKREPIANLAHEEALRDGLKRLLLPSLTQGIRTELTEQASLHGVESFAINLHQLLMSPPIKKTRVMAIDPGIRTGSKIVLLDETGKYLHHFVIYQNRVAEAIKLICDNAKEYKPELIAIGNGTGSHEVQEIVASAITDANLELQYTVVSEDGASVYSASPIAREEFPNLDLTIRGAISIGRRLQDPLAELVKIDPKSIGVGLYQHDLNQVQLSHSLDEVVESVVNRVGVNLNTASRSLLSYVSGISSKLAQKIVEFREENSGIQNRMQLKKVTGLGAKAFENCAGFLKIVGGENILDNSSVHPENYKVAKEIQKDIAKITAGDFSSLQEKYGVGKATIVDIFEELKKPSRDPREDFPKPIMQKGVATYDDIKEGMMVQGKVKNVVDFGAFVDIGIKETALVHISELSDEFVSQPLKVIKVGDVREFRVLSMDQARKRISLTLKSE